MDIFYEHMKIPVPGLGSIYLSSEPKGLHVNLQTTQTVIQALHKQILRACYWKHYPHNSWNTETGADTYLELSPLLTRVQGTRRYSACSHRGKVNTTAATKPAIYNAVLPARNASTIVAQSLFSITNIHLIWNNKHCMSIWLFLEWPKTWS